MGLASLAVLSTPDMALSPIQIPKKSDKDGGQDQTLEI